MVANSTDTLPPPPVLLVLACSHSSSVLSRSLSLNLKPTYRMNRL